MEALRKGIAAFGTPREILTDQGRQYTAWRGSTEFEEELRRVERERDILKKALAILSRQG